MKKLHSKRVGTLTLSAGMCLVSVLHKEQASPAPSSAATRQLTDHLLGSKWPYIYKKGVVQWTVVDALQFVPSKETCFAYKYQAHVDVLRDFCPQNSIHAHPSVYFFWTEACIHLTVCVDACTIWNTTQERNRIFRNSNAKSSTHSTVNNLRLKIMKAPWLTVSTQYCTTQELFRAITVVQHCNQRNCSTHRQIYTSLMKPTQQSLCVLYPSKKPLF